MASASKSSNPRNLPVCEPWGEEGPQSPVRNQNSSHTLRSAIVLVYDLGPANLIPLLGLWITSSAFYSSGTFLSVWLRVYYWKFSLFTLHIPSSTYLVSQAHKPCCICHEYETLSLLPPPPWPTRVQFLGWAGWPPNSALAYGSQADSKY